MAAVSFVLTGSAGPNAFSKIAHAGTVQGISDEISFATFTLGRTDAFVACFRHRCSWRSLTVAKSTAFHVGANRSGNPMERSKLGPGNDVALRPATW